MNDYDETYERIRDLALRFSMPRHGMAREARQLIVRFEEAGWEGESVSDVDHVHVREPAAKNWRLTDPPRDVRRWRLTNLHDLKDCIKTLEEAEKAAKEMK